MSALGQKQTFSDVRRMSALPPKADIGTQPRNVCFVETYASQQNVSLFDNLVGLGGKTWRHLNAERPGGLEVDDELKIARLHHRQVSGLLALENPSGVNTDLAIAISEIGAVAHQTTRL